MMTLTWYVLGVTAAWCAWLIHRAWRSRRIGWPQLIGLALGMFLLLFCTAWCAGSLLEGVPRAASMGLVCFGLPGIILTSVSVRGFFTDRPQPEGGDGS